MNKPQKIPMRKCLGCGEMMPKKELIRAVRSPEGEVSLDLTGKKNGRGAYICQSVACLKKARRSGRIDRSLNTVVPEEVYANMERELSEHE